MFRRLSILAVAVAAATMAIALMAPSASAQEAERGDTFLAGAGVLDARGDGLVAVKGRMNYVAHADRGVLLVNDIAGDAEIDVRGEGKCNGRFGDFTVCFGAGEAHITGSDVAVILVGHDLGVHVVGKGWAYLKGRGHYTVNGHGPFPWNQDGGFAGITAELGAE